MEITKSHVQQMLAIVFASLDDVYDVLALLGSFSQDYLAKNKSRDREYVVIRTHNEGLGFLTSALPILGDYFLTCLDGNIVKQRVAGFKPYDGLYPCFLRPVWVTLDNQVKSPTGHLAWDDLTDEFYLLVRQIRTLLLQFKKLELPPTEEQVAQAILKFKNIEDEMDEGLPYVSTALQRAQWVMELVLEGYTPKCNHPKHGPGAVAAGEKGNQKWEFDTYFESVHREWNLIDSFFPVRSNEVEREVDWRRYGQVSDFYSSTLRPHKQLFDGITDFRKWKRVPSPTARVLFVPKDSRGPRTITCEPKELMYLQQGVARHLMTYLEERAPFARDVITFRDQKGNQDWAFVGSETLLNATLDLSDASDRISCGLVQYLVPSEVWRKWSALRSTDVILPNKEKMHLKKFAAMGSALCFPVETLVFWVLCVGAVWEHTGNFDEAVSQCLAFGDDLIVPASSAPAVVRLLESVGLKVNEQKSFAGDFPFRESCGMDALNGNDVTPFRVRKFCPSSTTDGSGAVAWAQYADNCRHVMPHRARAFEEALENVFGALPRVPFVQSFLSFVDPARAWSLNDFTNPTWDSARSYYRCRLWALSAKKSTSPFVTNWSRLQKDLIESGPESTDPTVVVARTATLIGKKMSNITYLEFTAT